MVSVSLFSLSSKSIHPDACMLHCPSQIARPSLGIIPLARDNLLPKHLRDIQPIPDHVKEKTMREALRRFRHEHIDRLREYRGALERFQLHTHMRELLSEYIPRIKQLGDSSMRWIVDMRLPAQPLLSPMIPREVIDQLVAEAHRKIIALNRRRKALPSDLMIQ